MKLICALIVVASLLTGCFPSSSSSRPPSFFVLNSMATADEVDGPATVGIELTSLPSYLQRNGVVTRLSSTRIEVSESRRWAEPLEDGILRVLRENVASAMPESSVVANPWTQPQRPERIVSLSISRFEIDAKKEEAVLRVLYRVLDGEKRAVLLARESTYRVSRTSTSADASVKALSAALDQLSADLVVALTE